MNVEGQLLGEFIYTYEYDQVGNYIQRVTVDESGDTVEVFIRKISYHGEKVQLQNRADYVGKWLLIVHYHPEFKGTSFRIDFKADNTLNCKDGTQYGLSESGRWAIDLEKKRLKVWFETIGMRVSYRIIAPGVLQLDWQELDSSIPDSEAELKEVLLYKLN